MGQIKGCPFSGGLEQMVHRLWNQDLQDQTMTQFLVVSKTDKAAD